MRYGEELEYLRSLYRDRGLTDEEINERFRAANKKGFIWSLAMIVVILVGIVISSVT